MKITHRAFPILLFLSFLFSLNPIASSQRRTPQTSVPTAKPRLVLLIAIDQFRYDYLERFGDLYANNGFRRLLRDGASFVNANYDHYPTYTAPGHATMMTGAVPAASGIVGNEWIDKETGKRITSVSDATVKLLGGGPTETGVSPRRLLASTLGDELRLASSDRAKVIGISVKDRSAILPAGRHANAAYWFSIQAGSMVSSTYYFRELPPWVTNFNNTRPLDKLLGTKWERLLPENVYLKYAGPDSPPWENGANTSNDTSTFPHVLGGAAKEPGPTFYGALEYTPFTNDLLVSFAEQAIVNEELGQDDYTDVLTISFSANDYVGHRFGPYSQETMDAALRVDRSIGTLLDFVQTKIGLDKTIVALTADHGVSPIPEHADAMGLGGARLKATDFLTTIRAAISRRYNPQNKSPDPTADYIYKYDEVGRKTDALLNGNLYFNYDALARDGVDLNELQEVAAQAACTVRGIARCFTRNQLQRGVASVTDPIQRRVVHGFYPGRSGDIVVVAEPYKYLAETINATHGSPYTYDTHVPVIIMGRGVNPGRYLEEASPADIAPTFAALLGIQQPSSVTGRVLKEALVR